MASSFINFRNNGFWAKDGFVEAFQLLLFEEINNHYGNNIEWLNSYKKDIALQSLPLVYGGMSMCLDETLVDQSRAEMLITLIDIINTRISSEENYLTSTHLNSLRRVIRQYLIAEKEFDWDEKEVDRQVEEGAYYGGELPKSNYIRGFDLLRQLIAGQITFNAGTPITYWTS